MGKSYMEKKHETECKEKYNHFMKERVSTYVKHQQVNLIILYARVHKNIWRITSMPIKNRSPLSMKCNRRLIPAY